MGDPPPHRHLLAKYLVVMVNCGCQGDREYRTNYLFYFPYVVFLEYPESLHSHSFTVIYAFPNITKNARGDGLFSRLLDVSFGDGVGGRQKPRPTAELPKSLEDHVIRFSGLKGLRHTSTLSLGIDPRDSICRRTHLVKYFQQRLRPFYIPYQGQNMQFKYHILNKCVPQNMRKIIWVLFCMKCIYSGGEGSQIINQPRRQAIWRGLSEKRH